MYSKAALIPPDITPSVGLPSVEGAGQWHAHLDLRFRQTARGCRLMHKAHRGPLYVQRPFYPEGLALAHVYLLHPPGGLVSGDRLQVDIRLENAAQVLCTTPGASRVYRARPDRQPQVQINQLTVDAGSTLEWFPQENIIFRDANAVLRTQVDLAGDAKFCGWEITSLGLPANGIRFDIGQLRQRLQINRGGRPALIEQLQLTDEYASQRLFHGRAGLHRQPVCGVFTCGPWATEGPANIDDTALDKLQSCIATPSTAGVTRVGEFIVGRYLGQCTAQARELFIGWWRILRPLLLQRAAVLPAIWAT
ncbi:MAG: urease accessory protein UreD [Gammaproteobacteria bacterium]|nr:urease accessory protein UreD [Gammaproteobacteria bacterium]